MADVNQYMLMIMPWVSTILYLILGLGSVIGVGYYLFVIKRRRIWIANLYEQKADGRLHYVGRDKIIERKINKGKQVIYIMKKYRTEVIPPPWEATYRYFNKEYCDYIRVAEDDFRPSKKTLTNDLRNPEKKTNFIETVKEKVASVKRLTTKEVYDDFVFAPIHNTLSQEMEFDSIDYDINMMRINAIDNRDKIYADKQDFFQKYGPLITIGIIVVLIIVVLYMSYEYSESVIARAHGVIQAAKDSMVTDLATKINGGVPPS